MRGSAPWRSLRGMALQFSEHRGPAQQVLVCFVAEAGVGGGAGCDREGTCGGSFELGPLQNGFRWTHTLSGLCGHT